MEKVEKDLEELQNNEGMLDPKESIDSGSYKPNKKKDIFEVTPEMQNIDELLYTEEQNLDSENFDVGGQNNMNADAAQEIDDDYEVVQYSKNYEEQEHDKITENNLELFQN